VLLIKKTQFAKGGSLPKGGLPPFLFQHMPDKKPFTPEEQEIMNLIVSAHNKYCAIQPSNNTDGVKWMNAIHSLQDVLIYRVAKRDYPNVFK
jgi:hypothetical protein